MLRMQVSGEPTKVNQFMKGFQSQPEYEVVAQSQLCDMRMTDQAMAYAIFNLKTEEKSPLILQLTTSNQKELLLYLQDAHVEKSDIGVTFIRGTAQEVYW